MVDCDGLGKIRDEVGPIERGHRATERLITCPSRGGKPYVGLFAPLLEVG